MPQCGKRIATLVTCVRIHHGTPDGLEHLHFDVGIATYTDTSIPKRFESVFDVFPEHVRLPQTE